MGLTKPRTKLRGLKHFASGGVILHQGTAPRLRGRSCYHSDQLPNAPLFPKRFGRGTATIKILSLVEFVDFES